MTPARERNRRLILAVLGEEITEETDPLLFAEDNDTLYFALYALTEFDGEWLQKTLSEKRWSEKARFLIRRFLPR